MSRSCNVRAAFGPCYNAAMKHERINIDPAVMMGKPVIKGTRITVEHLLRELGGGLTEGEIISAHPHITNEDIRAAQAFAADYLQKHPWINYALRSRLTWTTNEHGEIAGVGVHDANFVELFTGDHWRFSVCAV